MTHSYLPRSCRPTENLLTSFNILKCATKALAQEGESLLLMMLMLLLMMMMIPGTTVRECAPAAAT